MDYEQKMNEITNRKSMFDPATERFTKEALDDLTKPWQLISEAVEILHKKGYRMRDVANALHSEVDCHILANIL